MNNAPREPIALVGFSAEELATLHVEVSQICKTLGDSKHQDRFIVAADVAVAEYRFYIASAEINGEKWMPSISEDASSLAAALEQLQHDRGIASLFIQKVCRSTGVPISPDLLETDIARFQAISRAASELIDCGLTVKNDVLICELGHAYADCFGATPSSSRLGLFAKLVEQIFRLAKITPVPSETRLKTVLSGETFNGAAPSRRGRRRSL